MKTKTIFKETDIGEIPEEWSNSKLIDLVEDEKDIVGGPFGSNLKVSDYRNNGVPIIRLQNIERNQFVNENIQYVSQEKAEELKYHSYLPGDIILAKLGIPIGKTCVVPSFVKGGIVVADVVRIRISPEKADSKFVEYALNSNICIKQLNQQTIGTTRPRVNINEVRNLEFPCPPLQEQQKIAEVLSTIDDTIQKSDEIIQKTQLLKNSMMNQLLTKGIKQTKFKQTDIGEIPENWDYKKITDLFEIETGTTPPTKNSSYWDGGNITWFTPADMSGLNGRLNIKDSRRKITEKALKESNLSLMPQNSILLSTRAPVGYVAVLEKPATFNQGCKGLIPKDRSVDSIFYAYLLSNKKDFLQSISSGSTFKELSKDSLSSLVFPQPPLSEQQQITSIISEIDKKIELEITRKEHFEQIKQGLMSDLLTGQKRLN